MDLDEIRKLSIVAMFADDEIMEQVVLKGGNALNLVYKIGSRSSIDLDFSLAADFKDVHDAEARILRALRSRFGSVGLTVFDELFEKKPALDQPDESPRWGGYQISFKLLPTAKVSRHATAIAKAKHERLGTELAALQRDSLVVGPNSLRTFTIEISKYEACAGKQKRELDNYEIYVYTTEMLAIEKVRAICQQMPGYPHRNRPRARDFYDIDAIAESSPIDFGSPRVQELIQACFKAKDVPLSFIAEISERREFHRPDWPAVQNSIPAAAAKQGFDYYVDRLVERLRLLEPLWKM